MLYKPTQRSLPHAVHLHAIARPNAPALLVWSTIERERRTISYCELAAHVSAARQHVRHLVLQCPGRTTCAKERIAILSHNSAAYLVHSLACMSLCSISVHLNWRMAPPTLGEQLVHLDCALLLVSTTLEAHGRQAAIDAPACRVEVFDALGPPLARLEDSAQERRKSGSGRRWRQSWQRPTTWRSSSSQAGARASRRRSHTRTARCSGGRIATRRSCLRSLTPPHHVSDGVRFRSRPIFTSWASWRTRLSTSCRALPRMC